MIITMPSAASNVAVVLVCIHCTQLNGFVGSTDSPVVTGVTVQEVD